MAFHWKRGEITDGHDEVEKITGKVKLAGIQAVEEGTHLKGWQEAVLTEIYFRSGPDMG